MTLAIRAKLNLGQAQRSAGPLAPQPPLRVQKLDQVGLVVGKPLPGGLELPHAVPAIAPLAFGLKAPHRDDGIDFPTHAAPC